MSYPDIGCRVRLFYCNVVHDVVYNITYDIRPTRVWSGGLFHYNKLLAYYVHSDKGLALFHDVPELQNMYLYRVTTKTDTHEFLLTSGPAIQGPPKVYTKFQWSWCPILS